MVWFSSWMQPHWLPKTSIDRCNHHSFADSQKPGDVSGFIPDDGPHLGRVAASCYAKLRILKGAKPFVPHQIFISPHSSAHPRNYCNSILVNASCRNITTLQTVMNTAARLIHGGRSSDHSSRHSPALAKNFGQNHLQNPTSSLQSRHRQSSSTPH